MEQGLELHPTIIGSRHMVDHRTWLHLYHSITLLLSAFLSRGLLLYGPNSHSLATLASDWPGVLRLLWSCG